jgi:hypothetical protein
MAGKYAFSLNGEHYRGTFSTREEAVGEAIAAARRCDDTPLSVYVGRRVPGDVKASGHARAVLANMTARAREEFGDAAGAYLTDVSKPQIEKLDEALQIVIQGWLQQNELMPTFSKIEAISEYPVPVTSGDRAVAEYAEVQEIGAAEE